jgi:hypothetical protein
VVEKVYAQKLKHDVKKVKDAMARDHWRFEDLPAQFEGSLKAGKYAELAKGDVERLVQWKM